VVSGEGLRGPRPTGYLSHVNPYCYDHPRPAVTVDILLFGLESGRIEVLLIKRDREPFRGLWALPGGFVEEDEALERAAERELREETGLTGIHLEQVGAYGDPGRDPRGHTVSIAYSAVIEAGRNNLKAGSDAADARWWRATRPPRLAFDHNKILRVAMARMFGK
jgi:8-oxo-dGTP diphosphatase